MVLRMDVSQIEISQGTMIPSVIDNTLDLILFRVKASSLLRRIVHIDVQIASLLAIINRRVLGISGKHCKIERLTELPKG